MRRPGTLRGRLALVAALVTAGWVVTMTIAVDVFLVHQLDNQAAEVLQARAEAAAAEVAVTDGRVTIAPERESDYSLDAGIWLYVGDQLRESPARSGRLTPATGELVGRGRVFRDVDGRRLFARPVRAADGRQVATIVAAVSLRPYTRGARLAVGGSIALAVLLLGSVYPVTRFVVGRALRPVADLSDQAARWSADDVSHRFGSERRPRELEELAHDLDGLLDRLAAVLRHERQLSAEISHELRTPLSRVTAEVELLQRGFERGDAAEADTRAGLAAALSGAQQVEQILETLLATARSESTAPPGRCRVDLAIEAALAALDLQHLDVRRGGSANAVAGVEQAVLLRILNPLLHNASRHSRSWLSVSSTLQDDAVELVVRDDGPGLADLGDRAFEPGVTGPGEHDGAGLGLPLARRLARAAGGDITVDTLEPGAVFRVRLPRA